MLVLVVCLCGCGVTVVPRATATAQVDPADNSISEIRNGVLVKARLHDPDFAPVLSEGNLTAFELTVGNRTGKSLSLPLSAFLLMDDRGTQYSPLPPERVNEILRRNSPYLLPYPYVGYYYLEDMEKAAAARGFTSSRPYFAQNRPADALVGALDNLDLVPDAQVTGLVFFTIDLTRVRSVELRGYLTPAAKDVNADFTLPFYVEKK
ncbi:MAG: hypothetical protein RBT64_03500 [Trichloromonas sp.]|nr:hypothetical protein [Trichloromonas sp.]